MDGDYSREHSGGRTRARELAGDALTGGPRAAAGGGRHLEAGVEHESRARPPHRRSPIGPQQTSGPPLASITLSLSFSIFCCYFFFIK